MKVLIDATDRLISMGMDSTGWVVPQGGAILDVPVTFDELAQMDVDAAAANVPTEVIYDRRALKLKTRPKVLSARERQRRDDIADLKSDPKLAKLLRLLGVDDD